MPTVNWNTWANAWSAAFPKNQMWRKIRSGENDPETGEPIYRFPEANATRTSMSGEMGDVLAAHRFINPAIQDPANVNKHHCFNDSDTEVVDDHGVHLQEAVDEFNGEGA